MNEREGVREKGIGQGNGFISPVVASCEALCRKKVAKKVKAKFIQQDNPFSHDLFLTDKGVDEKGAR